MTERTFPVTVFEGSIPQSADREMRALQDIILEQDAELEEQKSEIALLESLIHKDSVAYCDNFAKFQKQIRDLESARLADAELANAHAQKQNKIIFDLEAVQAKLADACLGYIMLSLGQAEIINNSPSVDPPSAEEIIAQARRECGIKEGGV